MKIQTYIDMFRQGWWIVLSIVLLSAGVGLAYSYSQTPTYEATATFVVTPSAGIAETYDMLSSLDTLAGRTGLATTYANILESSVVIDRAVEILNLPKEVLVGYEINSVVLPDSSILLLQIQGPSPFLVADLANTVGTAGLDFVSNLQGIYVLRRLDPATLPTEPISPDHATDLALSVIVGLAGGVGFLFLRQILMQPSDNPNSPSDHVEAYSMPAE